MKYLKNLVVVLLILLGMCVPALAEPQEQDIYTGVKNITVVMPTTGTALMGTKESMTDYQNYLNDCSGVIVSVSNQILVIFGQDTLTWNTPAMKPTPQPPTPIKSPTKTAVSSTKQPAPSKTVSSYEVFIKNNAFSPASLTVKAGSIVRWTNKDKQVHRIQFNEMERSPMLAYGNTYGTSFRKPGTYRVTEGKSECRHRLP